MKSLFILGTLKVVRPRLSPDLQVSSRFLFLHELLCRRCWRQRPLLHAAADPGRGHLRSWTHSHLLASCRHSGTPSRAGPPGTASPGPAFHTTTCKNVKQCEYYFKKSSQFDGHLSKVVRKKVWDEKALWSLHLPVIFSTPFEPQHISCIHNIYHGTIPKHPISNSQGKKAFQYFQENVRIYLSFWSSACFLLNSLTSLPLLS